MIDLIEDSRTNTAFFEYPELVATPLAGNGLTTSPYLIELSGFANLPSELRRLTRLEKFLPDTRMIEMEYYTKYRY